MTKTEKFIEKARLVHGNKYSYEETVYEHCQKNVKILCGVHGEFYQTPNNHISKGGQNCPTCKGVKLLTTPGFLAKAKAAHGDTYSYEKAVYVNAYTKLTVTCDSHGDFLVSPDSHTNKVRSGCPACKSVSISQKNRCRPEEFVPKAVAVHDEKYDYSKAVYRLSKDKMEIVCKEHGSFFMDANSHLRGSGCRKCAAYGYQTGKPGNFYILTNEKGLTKVGITNRVVQERVKKINRNSDLNFRQVLALRFENGANALAVETIVLASLRSQYKNPQQTYDGSTESFVDVDLPKLLQAISAIMTEKTTYLPQRKNNV